MANGLCARCSYLLDGKHPTYCLLCHAQYQRERRQADPAKARANLRNWQRANPEKMREYKKKFRLMADYGIAVEEFDAMLVDQDSQCAICYDKLELVRGKFAVDHDHTTGQVRAILCHGCNMVLGFSRENTYRLSRAIEYVRLHGLRKVV